MFLSCKELGMCFSKVHISTFKEFREMYHLPQGRWFKRSLLWWFQISWWLGGWYMNIRHYYSTVMLQRRKLVKGIFPSLTFYPCWNKSKYPMFFVFRGDTGTSMTVSRCQSPALKAMSRCFNLLFSLLSMSLKHCLFSSVPQLTIQPNCTISARTQLNT